MRASDRPGTVVLRSGGHPRFHSNSWCWHALVSPPGTQRVHKTGLEVARCLNQAIAEMTGDWLFVMDDDHTFDPSILVNLLATMDATGADVVVPLVLQKYP